MSIHIRHAQTQRTYHLHSIPPSKYIGVGEKVSDLQVFNKTAFVDSLFAKK